MRVFFKNEGPYSFFHLSGKYDIISEGKGQNSVNRFTKGSVLRRGSVTAAVWNFQIRVSCGEMNLGPNHAQQQGTESSSLGYVREEGVVRTCLR